jgi:hypothetical protein
MHRPENDAIAADGLRTVMNGPITIDRHHPAGRGGRDHGIYATRALPKYSRSYIGTRGEKNLERATVMNRPARSASICLILVTLAIPPWRANGAEQLALVLTAPLERQVFQRRTDAGLIYVEGTVPGGADRVDVQVMRAAEVVVPWHPIAFDTDYFNSSETLPAGGWYSVQVRAVSGDLATMVVVTRVGIGEVFLTSGQSNSANSASFRFTALDTVSAWNGTEWVVANDPQPIAGGFGGSTWAVLGNTLTTELNMPIGLVSVGVGRTAVRDWLPGAPPLLHRFSYPIFNRIAQQQQTFRPWGGIRAILWHQGESDSHQGTPTEVYCDDLTTIIRATRSQLGAGEPVPWWIIAHATTPYDDPQQRLQVLDGQSCAIHRNPLAFPGPDTDLIVVPRDRQKDDTHFEKRGQEIAGRAWAEAVVNALHEEGEPVPIAVDATRSRRGAGRSPQQVEPARGGGSVPFAERSPSMTNAAPPSTGYGQQRSVGSRRIESSARSVGARGRRSSEPDVKRGSPKPSGSSAQRASRKDRPGGTAR